MSGVSGEGRVYLVRKRLCSIASVVSGKSVLSVKP